MGQCSLSYTKPFVLVIFELNFQFHIVKTAYSAGRYINGNNVVIIILLI